MEEHIGVAEPYERDVSEVLYKALFNIVVVLKGTGGNTIRI